MELFLKEQQEKLRNADETLKIKVVLGNESCDLDSTVSSIVFAYFIYKAWNSTDITIPILNVKREDLFLRTEVVFFLDKTGISLADLVCIDEINLQTLQDQNRLSLILVDHNELSDEQATLQKSIVQIVDHHKVNNPEQIKRYDSKIETVGSCCTLVTEEILEALPNILDAQVSLLLYGTILLDTVCLQESAKRVTEKDKDMVSKLETFLGESRKEIYGELQKAKFDVSNLTPEQLLKKDTKYISLESTSVAISSLPMLLEDIVQKEEFISALVKMTAERKLTFVLALGTQITEDELSVRRQIAIYDPCQLSLEKVSNYLLSLESPSLSLRPLPLCGKFVHLFEQENSALSRKFVLPAIQHYLKTLHSDSCDVQEPHFNGTNENNLNQDSDNSLEEDNSNKNVLLQYQVETVDFPDSPSHLSLNDITSVQSPFSDWKVMNDSVETPQLESDDPDAGMDSIMSDGSGVRKKIFVGVSPLGNEDLDLEERSLSSLSNLEAFSQSDGETLNEDFDCSEFREGIPEMSAAEELAEERSWKSCVVNGEDRKIDMRAIEPYRKVLSHGGYEESTHNAIILFSACYLPNRSRQDYNYVMDNLFLYVVVTLDELVAENYVLIYLHGGTESAAMPSFGWLKRCYQMIDRRLRKNLKRLYLVHPTFWLKTIVIMTRPFISAKFSRKLRFVYSLKELSTFVPLDNVGIPDKVKKFDFEKTMREFVSRWKSHNMYSTLYSTYLKSLHTLNHTG